MPVQIAATAERDARRTTRNGIQAIVIAISPQVIAAVAGPLPRFDGGAAVHRSARRRGAERVDEALAGVGDVGRPGRAVEPPVLVAAVRIGEPSGRQRGRCAHGSAEYRRLGGDRPGASRPTGVGARRSERRRPAAHRARAPPGGADGRPARRRAVRRGAGVAAGAGAPDRGAAARPARARRADRPVAGGDPRSGLARHARRRRPSRRTARCASDRSTARWDGLEDGEPIRDFVERIRLGAQPVPGRARHQPHRARPADLDHRRARASGSPWSPTPAPTRCSCATCSACSPRRGSGTASCSGHASVSRIEALEVHGGFTFSLTSLSNLEHIPAADRTR